VQVRLGLAAATALLHGAIVFRSETRAQVTAAARPGVHHRADSQRNDGDQQDQQQGLVVHDCLSGCEGAATP